MIKPDDQTKLYEEIAKISEWEMPLTNEQFIRKCSKAELAKVFMRWLADAEFKARFWNGNFYDEFYAWLKEKHH